MRRRKGMGLVMALSIVVIGSALIAAMFNLSSVFTRTATFQRRGYTEHISMSSYLEKAKGFIVALNLEKEADKLPVLHGSGLPVSLDVNSADVRSVTDLQLIQTEEGIADALSLDIDLHTANGRKRLVMRVYDANYNPEWINISDWNGKKDLPPSLKLDVEGVRNGERMDGITGGPDTSIDGQDETSEIDGLAAQQYRNYGAYVVRLELYNVLHDGTRVLERDIEEGFFQAINQKK